MADSGVTSRWESLVNDRIPQLFVFGWLYGIPVAAIVGVGGIAIYAIQVPSGVRWLSFGTAVAVAAAAFVTGGFVGFLFGIPRAAANPPPGSTRDNTTLEEVSDWLTKIIIGVSLVQVGRIAPALGKFADTLKTPLGDRPSSAAFGLALVIFYALLGFFNLYLWSRSLLAREWKPANGNGNGGQPPTALTQQSPATETTASPNGGRADAAAPAAAGPAAAVETAGAPAAGGAQVVANAAAERQPTPAPSETEAPDPQIH